MVGNVKDSVSFFQSALLCGRKRGIWGKLPHTAGNTWVVSDFGSHRSLSQRLYNREKEPVKADSRRVDTGVIAAKGVGGVRGRGRARGWLPRAGSRTTGISIIASNVRRRTAWLASIAFGCSTSQNGSVFRFVLYRHQHHIRLNKSFPTAVSSHVKHHTTKSIRCNIIRFIFPVTSLKDSLTGPF